MRQLPRSSRACQRRSFCLIAGIAALVGLAVVSCSLLDLTHLRSRSRRRHRFLAEDVHQVDPTQSLYEALVAGSLSANNSAVLSALAHAPWLLPPKTEMPYSGMENDLDGLLRTQTNRTVQGFPAVTMIFFNHHHRTMLMNCIYSLVKWFRPLVVSKVLEKGYAVHLTDVDIAYSPFDLYASFGAFINNTGIAGVFMAELPVNSGNYLLLPTPATHLMFQRWLSMMDPSIALGFHDQDSLSRLVMAAYDTCDTWNDCVSRLAAKNESTTDSTAPLPKALLRRTPSAFQELFGSWCAGGQPEKLTPVDRCQPGFSFAYFHVICVTGAERKAAGLKGIGYWFLEESCVAGGPLSNCKPLAWSRPGVEDAFLRCPSSRLAFNAQ
ncbi:hypothetical protein N2152v2_002550 [Parachlorella kessleri]